MLSLSGAEGQGVAEIGPYALLERLGEGGAGVVWRARHRDSGIIVALKTVRVVRTPHLSSVRREIAALQRIRHPGIVRILEGGVQDGRPWCAMELLEGQTLEQLLGVSPRVPSAVPTSRPPISPDATTQEGLPPSAYQEASRRDERAGAPRARPAAAGGRLREVLTLVRRLCAPLGFLHGEGLVHRDLKPSNVFVRPDGTPVLMDFGLVGDRRGALGREVLEEVAEFLGTVGYMAPEQVRGESEDARTDLYALGCVLYQAVTGQLPFDGRTNAEILSKHLGAEPEPPSRLVSGVPPALDELVLRLLAKSPRERIGHADDVARRLAVLGAEGWPGGDPARSRAYLYQPRLVGRTEPVDEVLEALAAARRGEGRLVLVGGPSGIGKTSLVAEVARLATGEGAEVITGACLAPSGREEEAERGSPLHPFRLLLQRIAERCVAGGPAATGRLLGRHRRLLAQAEPALAQVPFDEAQSEPPPLPPQAARERVLDALAQAVLAFSEDKPLLLVIDDVQWADDLSLALLELLGRRLAGRRRLAVIATFRSEEVGPGLAALLEQASVRRIPLDRLEDRDVATMVADMLGLPQAPPELAAFVARESEGNPFFVAEYLRTALAEGLLFRDLDGRWQRDERAATTALALPRNLRALVERHLAGLSQRARALVEVAAVIGRELDPDLLGAVAERSLGAGPAAEEQVIAATSELLARQVFAEAPGSALAFVHDKLREIAYQATSAERRRTLHRAVAERLEARAAGSPLFHAKLAHHHRHGGDLARAVEYLEKAGLYSLAQSANGDAAVFLDEALRLEREAQLAVDPLRRARWERLAGEARQGLGNLAASKDHLRRAVALLGFPEPARPAALAARVLLEIGRQALRRLWPFRRRAPVVDSAALLEAARAYDRLFQVYYYEAAPLPLFHANLRTLAVAERAEPSPELASAYANAYGALSLIPPLRRLAAVYLRRAERALARVADPAVESYLELLRAVIGSGAGAWADAERRLDRVVSIAAQLGYRRRWEEAKGVSAFNRLLTGAVDQALAEADAVYQSAARGDRQTQCWSLLERAQAKLALGLLDDALADARAASSLAEALGRDERIWAQGTLALAAYRRGDAGGARAAAERALAQIAAGPPLMGACLEAYAAVAEVFLGLWEAASDGAARAGLVRPATRACRALETFARVFPFARPRATLRRGDLHHLRGSPRKARACYESARAAARALGMPGDEGLAALRLAERAPAPDRPALLAQAADLLARGGQHHLAARARERAAAGADQRPPDSAPGPRVPL